MLKCTVCNENYAEFGDICDECRFAINHVYSPEPAIALSVIPKTMNQAGGRVLPKKGQD